MISSESSNNPNLFIWTRFYEAVADGILAFRDRRDELVRGIHGIASNVDGISNLQDRYKDGSSGPLKDICPFTTMGIFNRQITSSNRRVIAIELANLLGVTEPYPVSGGGIPALNNQNSWFFGFENKRQADDIDALWEAFSQAIVFADLSDTADVRPNFVVAFDRAMQCFRVKWNLTMGMYWIRPWKFPTLDSRSQRYISEILNIRIGMNGPKGCCTAKDYLTVLDALEARFQEDKCPVHSFPELSFAAFTHKYGAEPDHSNVAIPNEPEDHADTAPKAEVTVASVETYSIDTILEEGCFVSRDKLEGILERLGTKKNLILQGPPGTGKTWLAKRLAFALIEQRDDSKVRPVQFHPNLSYEDFIRGWRPMGDGKLALVDGPFMEIIEAAIDDQASKYVAVIEEINRGNPAQIFGEMLTLLENDKRSPNAALELSYKRSDDERIFIPSNLYVIGTMNIADRSLALVDLALRRRFAFINLEPAFGSSWREWAHSQCGVDSEVLVVIEERLEALNKEISADTGLGTQFQIGHSYVTPAVGDSIGDSRNWFRQVVETEIGPLLDEYWFDALERSQKAKERLLEGF